MIEGMRKRGEKELERRVDGGGSVGGGGGGTLSLLANKRTPTILSSDMETASRTSGRRGKHSRTPREV
ncbi:unnamed protein product [Pleuronectes platessa]|uniref:Uncharacterized protein n=1 Tax=Pleuronectes platessa TaxID=8262 RepID=A0A9N7ZBF6_PLEPL|nr:unnamed protein product [Pleuronectes platessa]